LIVTLVADKLRMDGSSGFNNSSVTITPESVKGTVPAVSGVNLILATVKVLLV
jgi:hypothetical protein